VGLLVCWNQGRNGGEIFGKGGSLASFVALRGFCPGFCLTDCWNLMVTSPRLIFVNLLYRGNILAEEVFKVHFPSHQQTRLHPKTFPKSRVLRCATRKQWLPRTCNGLSLAYRGNRRCLALQDSWEKGASQDETEKRHPTIGAIQCLTNLNPERGSVITCLQSRAPRIPALGPYNETNQTPTRWASATEAGALHPPRLLQRREVVESHPSRANRGRCVLAGGRQGDEIPTMAPWSSSS